MPSSVRVNSNSNGGAADSRAAGLARVKLKLAALAYASARHGIDADVGLSRAGLQLLCQAALDYAETLTGKRPVDPYLQLDNGT